MNRQIIRVLVVFLSALSLAPSARAAQGAAPLVTAAYADLNNDFAITLDTRGALKLLESRVSPRSSRIGSVGPTLLKKILAKSILIHKRDLKQKDPNAQPGLDCPTLQITVFRADGDQFDIYFSTACVEKSLPEVDLGTEDDSGAILAIMEFMRGLISVQAEN